MKIVIPLTAASVSATVQIPANFSFKRPVDIRPVEFYDMHIVGADARLNPIAVGKLKNGSYTVVVFHPEARDVLAISGIEALSLTGAREQAKVAATKEDSTYWSGTGYHNWQFIGKAPIKVIVPAAVEARRKAAAEKMAMRSMSADEVSTSAPAAKPAKTPAINPTVKKDRFTWRRVASKVLVSKNAETRAKWAAKLKPVVAYLEKAVKSKALVQAEKTEKGITKFFQRELKLTTAAHKEVSRKTPSKNAAKIAAVKIGSFKAAPAPKSAEAPTKAAKTQAAKLTKPKAPAAAPGKTAKTATGEKALTTQKAIEKVAKKALAVPKPEPVDSTGPKVTSPVGTTSDAKPFKRGDQVRDAASLSPTQVRFARESDDSDIRYELAKRKEADADTIALLVKDKNPAVRSAAAANPNLDKTTFQTLFRSRDPIDAKTFKIASDAFKQRSTQEVLDSTDPELHHLRVRMAPSLDAKQMDAAVNSEDAGVRYEAAKRKEATPVQLTQLSKDPKWTIRSQVAQNPNTPRMILDRLLGDPENRVRRDAVWNPQVSKDELKKYASSFADMTMYHEAKDRLAGKEKSVPSY